jgi:hypothetical protein
LRDVFQERNPGVKRELPVHKTVTVPVVLHVYESWFRALRKKYRVRVFGSKVLRNMFGAKKGMEKILNEGLHDFYSPPNIIRVIKSRRITWAGYVAVRVCEERCIQGFGGEP